MKIKSLCLVTVVNMAMVCAMQRFSLVSEEDVIDTNRYTSAPLVKFCAATMPTVHALIQQLSVDEK